MTRLTREDWKNPNSSMWEKVDELNVTTEQKKAIKEVLEKLAQYEDQEDTGKGMSRILPLKVRDNMSARHICKAKRKDNGEWIEGFYVMYSTSIECPYSYTNGKHCIQTVPHNIQYEIDPETVCQYTGLTEKNGEESEKIWENDIVEIIWRSGKIERYLVWWSREMSMMTVVSLKDIKFNGHDYWGGQPQIEYSAFCLMMQDPWGDIKEVKTIGNIFDDPELPYC